MQGMTFHLSTINDADRLLSPWQLSKVELSKSC